MCGPRALAEKPPGSRRDVNMCPPLTCGCSQARLLTPNGVTGRARQMLASPHQSVTSGYCSPSRRCRRCTASPTGYSSSRGCGGRRYASAHAAAREQLGSAAQERARAHHFEVRPFCSALSNNERTSPGLLGLRERTHPYLGYSRVAWPSFFCTTRLCQSSAQRALFALLCATSEPFQPFLRYSALVQSNFSDATRSSAE